MQSVVTRLCQARKSLLGAALLLCGVSATEELSAQPASDDDYRELILTMHNSARTKYAMPELRWSDKLSEDSRVWAQSLIDTNTFEHSPNRRNTGENLWMGTSYAYGVKEMVNAFLDEEREFKPGIFPNVVRTGNHWKAVGHFTQVIWPETREVGCAIVRGPEDDVFVCHYWPAGNVYGRQLP